MYVNDAFGTAHREHASTYSIASFFPGKAASGFLLDKEINFLGKTLANPTHPFYAIIGGAKISSKIGILHSLLAKVDAILIGGAMAYTFYKARGWSIGNSLYEEEQVQLAYKLLREAEGKNIKILLPLDNIVTDNIKNPTKTMIVESSQGIPEGMEGADIGPKTIKCYQEQIKDAKTVFWNGPMGVFEKEEFARGTNQLAEAVANLSQATTIVGGGDSIAALQQAHLIEKISHASTGGGASLEYIEFGKLPGIEILTDK